jgi:hypothetical protein
LPGGRIVIRRSFDVDNFALIAMDFELKFKTDLSFEFDLNSRKFEI